ncbi:MAG TPA: ABC transporter ATP-binding protein [Geobacterales bacterium]|nr:ABC transporter ATP-binding protein [Geobacterales bacterium]
MDAIRTDNLIKRFGEVTAVDGLTLSVRPGELFGLIGPDGAGKSTTMRMLTAIMNPGSGDAWVLGRQTSRDGEAIKGEIGYMSQRFGLYPDLTVQENLHFYADIYGMGRVERNRQIDRLLAFSNLAPFRQRRAGNLSGGMKQKLGLACALIHTPKILFLDEPTNGVDPVSRRDFWRILYQLLRQQVTIFVTTAYLDEADRCHRVGLIHQGRLIACDTPVKLRQLLQGTLMELRTESPRVAALQLRQSFPPSAVGIFGDRIHLLVDDVAQGSALARQILDAANIPLWEMKQIEPSLEDVFVSVIGGRNRV